ncbi:MAG TPA: hydrogen peroxide-dependent heme synthase [Actinomycetota bacterium]|jgi:chlorite dismutase
MTDTIYALYPIFASTPDLREALADPADRARATKEVEELIASWAPEITVRGAYSTVGFRPDADLMLWLVAPTPDDVQRAFVEFRRTEVGDLLEPTWSFLGVVKPAEFTADHAPAFVKGEPPGRYLCVYPFVRSAEWYLLPREERASYLQEHGVIGREFPEVLANTTSGFGLGDWEWILAFEAERLDAIVDCIRRLRDAEARRFTKEEVPFVTGIRKDVADALDDLV